MKVDQRLLTVGVILLFFSLVFWISVVMFMLGIIFIIIGCLFPKKEKRRDLHSKTRP
jgi:energy-coupling factor transporter transmembrane protein EcfT